MLLAKRGSATTSGLTKIIYMQNHTKCLTKCSQNAYMCVFLTMTKRPMSMKTWGVGGFLFLSSFCFCLTTGSVRRLGKRLPIWRLLCVFPDTFGNKSIEMYMPKRLKPCMGHYPKSEAFYLNPPLRFHSTRPFRLTRLISCANPGAFLSQIVA